MTSLPVYSRGVLTLLVCVLLTGCISVQKLTPDYFVLIAVESTSTGATHPRSVGVGPVKIAAYLKRPQLVTFSGPALAIHENARWAEPLDQGIQRVMVKNLRELSGFSVVTFPWTRSSAPDHVLRLQISELNQVGKYAELELTWQLESSATASLLTGGTHQFRVALSSARTSATETDSAALVSAYSNLLEQAARHIIEKGFDKIVAEEIPPTTDDE